MAQRIRIALVGIGKIARDQHIPALDGDNRFDLVAVVSRSRVEGPWRWFATLADLFNSDVEVDAVSLCTPPQPRYPLARLALEAGKAVMLEKPPGATLGEVEALRDLAELRGVTLYASWHSRQAPAVQPARAWLAERTLKAVRIFWKEDVRVWHPGQDWIWEAGGLGVFDPGINALSIITRILPRQFSLTRAVLHVPENRQSPVKAELAFVDTLGLPIAAEFDFLQTGPQSWDIEVDTDAGSMRLSHGGARMWIDGVLRHEQPEGEYAGLYDQFSGLILRQESDVDVTPLRHVADAFLLGTRVVAPAFIE